MYAHIEDQEASEVMALTSTLQATTKEVNARCVGNPRSYLYDEEKHEAAVTELKEKMRKLKIVSRAKVTKERVYSAAYHPERTKDLVFFGGLSSYWHYNAGGPLNYLQTSMGHWAYGMPVHLKKKLMKTATRLPLMMLRVVSLGESSYIGRPHPVPLYHPSDSIPSTRIV